MSVGMVVHCDTQYQHGTCPQQTAVRGVADADAARKVARERGWVTGRDGQDRCPRCSGRRP